MIRGGKSSPSSPFCWMFLLAPAIQPSSPEVHVCVQLAFTAWQAFGVEITRILGRQQKHIELDLDFLADLKFIMEVTSRTLLSRCLFIAPFGVLV